MDLRDIIVGTKYEKILQNMEAGKGLFESSRLLVNESIEQMKDKIIETGKEIDYSKKDKERMRQLDESAEEREKIGQEKILSDAIEPILSSPIVFSLEEAKEIGDELEDEMVDIPPYDPDETDLSQELLDFLESTGTMQSMIQEFKTEVFNDLKEKIGGWTEVSEFVNKLAETKELKNYLGHCVFAALTHLTKEQAFNLGGIEEGPDEEADEKVRIQDEKEEREMAEFEENFNPDNMEDWKDTLRDEYKSSDWKRVLRGVE